MVDAITPPRLIRFAHYDLRVLSFVDIKAEEHNGCSKDDLNIDLGT